MSLESEILTLQQDALTQLEEITEGEALSSLRQHFFGKGGAISRLSEGMRHLSQEERPVIGKQLHFLRESLIEALEAKENFLQDEADKALFANLDLTLPGTPWLQGGLHPMTLLVDRAVKIFQRLGFDITEGPDIEDEWHCFDALNTPADHPARQEQDTFYFGDGRLLRTQTSTVQVRIMEQEPPPLRIISPGAAYRRDEIDATHLSQFTQMEGLYVAPEVSLGDLKGALTFFLKEFFGPETECRFRPHYFPFTEPSYEIDVRSEALGGEWMELVGCGMVDPAVLEAICERRQDHLYHPDRVSGFAFGIGLERLVMQLTGIDDIRMLVENDLRFLERFIGS